MQAVVLAAEQTMVQAVVLAAAEGAEADAAGGEPRVVNLPTLGLIRVRGVACGMIGPWTAVRHGPTRGCCWRPAVVAAWW